MFLGGGGLIVVLMETTTQHKKTKRIKKVWYSWRLLVLRCVVCGGGLVGLCVGVSLLEKKNKGRKCLKKSC